MPLTLSRFVCLAGLGLVLAGCDSLNPLDLFSKRKEDILTGTRVSILSVDRGLAADPSIADLRVSLPEPYVNDAWVQYGGNPAHAMYHLSLGAAPRQVWSRGVGAGSDDSRQLLAQPLVANGNVYAMDALSEVTAFNAESGEVVWRTDLAPDDEDDGYFGGGIAFDGGRIFVTAGFAKVFALDAQTGAVIWSQKVAGPMRAAPAAEAGRVFAVTLDNQTFALAADDGRRLWEHSGIQETTSLIGGASPAVSGSTVVVAYSSGEIVSLLAETGRPLWSDSLSSVTRADPLGDLAQIRGAPVIDRGVVLAVSHSGRMVAIDLRQGVRAWEAEIGGVEMPWAAGEFIYVVTNDAQVVCLTRRDGRLRWVQPLPRFNDPEEQSDPIAWSGPVLAGDRLIVAGSQGQALSISPYTGEVLGSIELPAGVRVAPVVAGNSLYFLTDGGDLVAMR